ncbi:hypothetical protein L2E82_31577 [Cichorium intybus]|uniref:Uncharacterized protein n=1 Tax=Cichorium intybus TaxID=13427 RepID=A0ACB9BGB7_CICIN|nr:hypothetical protein L2E82_31577 [Cichorium intybus]
MRTKYDTGYRKHHFFHELVSGIVHDRYMSFVCVLFSERIVLTTSIVGTNFSDPTSKSVIVDTSELLPITNRIFSENHI